MKTGVEEECVFKKILVLTLCFKYTVLGLVYTYTINYYAAILHFS